MTFDELVRRQCASLAPAVTPTTTTTHLPMTTTKPFKHNLFLGKKYLSKERLEKLVIRLIILFLSTEIFSKRRKIFTIIEEKPELQLIQFYHF